MKILSIVIAVSILIAAEAHSATILTWVISAVGGDQHGDQTTIQLAGGQSVSGTSSTATSTLYAGFWWPVGTPTTSVQRSEPLAGDRTPRVPMLHPASPNPFSSAVSLRFEVPAGAGRLRLSVFDVTGRHVRTLVDEQVPPGHHMRAWDGRDQGGDRLGSGIYFARLRVGDWHLERRILLLK